MTAIYQARDLWHGVPAGSPARVPSSRGLHSATSLVISDHFHGEETVKRGRWLPRSYVQIHRSLPPFLFHRLSRFAPNACYRIEPRRVSAPVLPRPTASSTRRTRVGVRVQRPTETNSRSLLSADDASLLFRQDFRPNARL